MVKMGGAEITASLGEVGISAAAEIT